MGVLDYDPAGMESLADTLTTAATTIMAERSRLNLPPSEGFAGPAAVRLWEHASQQAVKLDAAYADLVSAANALVSKAVEIRAEQAALRARIAREAEQRAEFNRIVRESGS